MLIILYILAAWMGGKTIQGWTSLMLVVVSLGAVQMFVLALMGEYIGRLYSQSKHRPLYIVQDVVGGGAFACRAAASESSPQPKVQRRCSQKVISGVRAILGMIGHQVGPPSRSTNSHTQKLLIA